MLVKKIPLQIHSHKGDQFDPPQNLLNGSSSKQYYSVCDTIKDDWIIFSSKESMSYIPTRLKLEVSPFSKECPKDFNIYIGDRDKDEWIKCNDETLCGKQEQYEEFVVFDIVRIYDEYDNRWIYKDKMLVLTHGFIRSCSNAIPDDIISICMAYTGGDNHKIEAIVKNKYSHFKWEILSNHGSPYYISARQFIFKNIWDRTGGLTLPTVSENSGAKNKGSLAGK